MPFLAAWVVQPAITTTTTTKNTHTHTHRMPGHYFLSLSLDVVMKRLARGNRKGWKRCSMWNLHGFTTALCAQWMPDFYACTYVHYYWEKHQLLGLNTTCTWCWKKKKNKTVFFFSPHTFSFLTFYFTELFVLLVLLLFFSPPFFPGFYSFLFTVLYGGLQRAVWLIKALSLLLCFCLLRCNLPRKACDWCSNAAPPFFFLISTSGFFFFLYWSNRTKSCTSFSRTGALWTLAVCLLSCTSRFPLKRGKREVQDAASRKRQV